MNGAESLIRALEAGGIETCFTNPGTSEMHIVAALDRAAKMRCVLALFEGVVSGAADGYARIAEKPACTLLHLGPGFANSMANLHNASRARVPIVNIAGQHPAEHLRYDTPLKSDVEAIARPYSQWLRTSSGAAATAADATQAIIAARTPPGQIATLIVPAEAAWSEAGQLHPATALPIPKPPMPGSDSVEQAAAMLRSNLRTALLLAGPALYGRGLAAAGRIADATGAKLFAPYPFARMERGLGLPRVDRIHYVLEDAIEQLKEFRQLILVGAAPPVAYFAYPDKSSVMTSPDCKIHVLTTPSEDGVGALESLSSDFPTRSPKKTSDEAQLPTPIHGDISPHGVAAAIASLLPENSIVVDESMTSGRGLMAGTARSAAHDWLANTGGSIGIALPMAVGAAVASPERRVLCLSADGSSMYTVQALWTMARYGLKVATVIFANRAYAVLKREFAGLGVGAPG
ncbi:MAG: acetolactate synthase large subunit, partial [Acidobacteriales bacterium]|nr:acetolactate synthase large subunit [Terriglobales bacterium]